ncbi:hypothetical protein HRI_004463900 [Hibiscus trionum]|uniref:Retrotransposon gag domain-containing protein n=1 Tax=Hibiscus trionum TaxID=183268 RepID=A0A9W7MPE9_HIBTR|nr:hypothetical protein HRI_004463900 [Hibiscus trionum]
MSATNLARDDESPQGSSTKNGDSVAMRPSVEPEQPREQPRVQVPPSLDNATIETVHRESFINVKEIFDHFATGVRAAPVVVAPSQAPIDKLASHRATPFSGFDIEKPEKGEQWLDKTIQILTKQLKCSDEHKLECAVSLLTEDALSWWETTILTTPAASVTWDFFVDEFKNESFSIYSPVT